MNKIQLETHDAVIKIMQKLDEVVLPKIAQQEESICKLEKAHTQLSTTVKVLGWLCGSVATVAIIIVEWVKK